MPLTLSGTTGIAGVDGSASTPSVQGSDTNTGVFYPAADTVGVSTGGSERMRVDSSGNVGIGTSSPSSYANYTSLTINGTDSDVDWLRGGTRQFAIYTNSTLTALNGVANLPLVFYTNNSERMRIDSSGNVGVGTSSPSYKLDVNGATSANYLNLNANTAAAPGVDAAVTRPANGTLAFIANAAERMRIDSAGNGFFGTTTSYGRFTVVPTTTQYSFASNAPNSSGTYYHFHCLAAGTTVGSIASTSTTTTYSTSSDYRLKHSVQTMTSGLATIAALKPVTYKWNIDDSIGEGFIAHELAEHIPLAVVGEKDAINEDGSINAQSVDYSKIVVHLVAAVQELSAKVDAQAAEIAALKANAPA